MAFDSIMTLDLDDYEPLKIIGYEASPLCIAKMLVMLQMMKNDKVNARSIIEVWLSSLWSEQTSQSFKRAVSELLVTNNELNRQGKVDPQVLAQIHCEEQRSSTPLSIERSRSSRRLNCYDELLLSRDRTG